MVNANDLLTDLVYNQKSHKMMSEYLAMPRDLWRNDCPIVLVHGFAG